MRCVNRGFVMYVLFQFCMVWINVGIGIFELFHLHFASSDLFPVFYYGVEWEESERWHLRYDT
jgi:hypothetical protein